MTRHSRYAWLFLILLMTAAAFAACGADDDDDPVAEDSGEEEAEPPDTACHRAVLTSGLGLAWDRLNHRISLWDVHPESEGCPDAVPSDVALATAHIGGPWSTGQAAKDAPIVKYGYFAVDSPSAAFAHVAVPVTLDAPGARASVPVTVALSGHGMGGYESYAVLLSGLTLTTAVEQADPDYPKNYDPSYGYTSRGIGAGVEGLTVADGTAAFTAWVRFEHGKADRINMNRAIDHARTTGVVHATLAGFNGGKATAARHAYSIDYPDPPVLFAKNYPHAPDAMRSLSIAGAPGFTVAAIALQSFSFTLFGSVEKGDYMRELSALATLQSYDPATGTATVDVDGYASNVGLLTYERMENDFAAGVLLLQLPGGVATAGAVEKEFETGTTTIALP